MKRPCSFLLGIVAVASLHAAGEAASPPADAHRHAEVARRGADVMPFDLSATTHVFTRTPRGGVQRVVAKDPADGRQVALVREHLRDIRAQFAQGDFSGPAHIHGHEMPGLAELEGAPPGRIDIEYQEVPAGAELTYRTADDRLVAALHRWFDAQLADHGRDAMSGHHHHPPHTAPAGK
jgi:hypothetical protein